MQGNQKFVPRFERAAMQYVILAKAKEIHGVTKENLQAVFRGNLQPLAGHLDECLTTLTNDGHLKQNGNKYTITDDGREDVDKLQIVVAELNQFVVGAIPTGNPKPTQAATAGGGAQTRSGTPGNVGAGTQTSQPKGGPGETTFGNR